MQVFLKQENCPQSYDCAPFVYGRSTANQRIESWWGILRKHCAQFWMNLFQEMKDNFIFDGNFLDKALMQFCFINFIQVHFTIINVCLLMLHERTTIFHYIVSDEFIAKLFYNVN